MIEITLRECRLGWF